MTFECCFREDITDDEVPKTLDAVHPQDAAEKYAEWAYHKREGWDMGNRWSDCYAVAVRVPGGQWCFFEISIETALVFRAYTE